MESRKESEKESESEAQLLKKYRRRSLLDDINAEDLVEVSCDSAAVRRILPHRPPLLFVDSVVSVDSKREMIVGHRHISADDPVFAGHFPDYPLYPGTFQIEAIGQLGLCLWYFRSHPESTRVPEIADQARVIATRIGGALFNAPVEPGRDVTLVARRLADDGMRASIIGQLLVGETVCTTSIGEVVFL